MKKITRYLCSFFLLCTMLLLSTEVFRAADITMSTSAKEINIGSAVTVTIEIPSTASGTLDLIYSSDVLEFSSATADVNSSKAGTIAISIGKYGLAGNHKISITFKAKTTGIATVTAKGIEFWNNETGEEVALANTSTKITVLNETTTPTLSADNYLAKLSVTAGGKQLALSPTFNYKKLDYSITVANEIEEIVVSATRSSGKAQITSMTGNGKVRLAVGANKVEIVVQAENGKTRTYTITITRKDKEAAAPVIPIPEPQEPDFIYGGEKLFAAETPDAKIPQDFVEKTLILNTTAEVKALYYEKGDLILLYLENSKKVGNLYIYNEADHLIAPFIRLSCGENYVIVLPLSDKEGPEGYEKCTLSMEGKGAVSAYQVKENAELADFYLLDCYNQNGDRLWYFYDSAEGTYQRYVGALDLPQIPGQEDPGDEPDTTPEDENDPPEVDDAPADAPGNGFSAVDWAKYRGLILSGIVFFVAILVILVINILLAKKKIHGLEEEEEADEDEEPDEDGDIWETSDSKRHKERGSEKKAEENFKESREAKESEEVEFLDL